MAEKSEFLKGDPQAREAPEDVPAAGGALVAQGETGAAKDSPPLRAVVRREMQCPALYVPPPAELYTGYDAEREEKEYARSLLTAEGLARLKAEVEEHGFLTVANIRQLLEQNTTSKFTQEGIFVLDADIIMQIDQRTRDCTYILPDNTAYFRDELMRMYPFDLFQTTPEEIFDQQEVGVFPARASALTQSAKEYLVRDLGSDDEFLMLEDMIGRLTRRNYTDRRPPERVVKTKVFLGREAWNDFILMVKQTRAVRRIVGNALRKSKGGEPGFLGLMYAGSGAQLLSLEDAQGIDERLRKQEEAIAKREEEIQKREKELDRQAEELAALLADL